MGGYLETEEVQVQREDTDIEWDTSVITEQKGATGISLSDLYGVQ